MWTNKQIIEHRLACEILNKIKDETFKFIAENKKEVTEYKVQQFILDQFKRYNLVNEIDAPIVAFNEDAAIPHFYPKRNSKKLRNNSIILIDIWARLNKENAPYSDITWMAYYGEIPEEVERVYNTVIRTRNAALDFIKKRLERKEIPTGKEVDDIARKNIVDSGYEKNIKHRTGHSIGLKSPHGEEKHVNSDNLFPLKKRVGYTIEPGVYFDKKFGIRSEINFLIGNNYKLIVTTRVQREIARI